MGLFLGFLSCSTGLYFCFCASSILSWCLDDLKTVALYNLKSGRLISPAPFFFLKTALAIRGLLYFHMNCEIFCSSSVKNAIGNLIGIALNLWIARENIVILTILILPTQEHGNLSICLHHLWFLTSVSYNFLCTVFCLFAAKDGEALYSQQKQDQELTVAQTMNSLLPNSDLNWRK